MPAATNRQDLIAVTRKEYEKLAALLAKVDPDLALSKDMDDTSIRDVLCHRAHWIGLFFGWYEDGQAGKTVHFPAEGYKWSELKPYNAMLREKYRGVSWPDAQAMLAQAHDKLADFIENKSDTELYGGPMEGANNNWTPGRWAEAAGPSHYRSAAKYIRQRIKAGI